MNTQLKKGLLELCVLAILRKKDCYGYELVNEILQAMEISEGTIYPLLRRLVIDKLVTTYLQESNKGPSRKYYKLTIDGIKSYTKLITEWTKFQKSINDICL